MREFALALCAVMALGSRPVSAQLLVDPLEVSITAAGANRVFATFTAANTSDVAVQATITRQDWDRLEDGDNRFLPAGSSGKSCGQLLSVSPLSIRVEPHSSRVVRLAVQNAADLKRECWDIVFVEEIPQRVPIKGNSLHYIFRTGVKVYVAPPGLARDGAIENMSVVDSAPAGTASSTPVRRASNAVPKKQIAVQFHNTGEMHYVAKGRLEFRRLDNTLAMQVPIAEFPTLPGAVRTLRLDVPSELTAGDYIVLALIDFGGAELVAGQIDYQAK